MIILVTMYKQEGMFGSEKIVRIVRMIILVRMDRH